MADAQTIELLSSMGAHYGYSRSRKHPSVSSRLFGVKNGILLVDLDQTAEALARAEAFLKGIAAAGKQVLFSGNKPEVQDLVRAAAERVQMPFVAKRWIGGTFTNFGEIKRRLARLTELEEMADSRDYTKYTKQERALFEKERQKLDESFRGIRNMPQLPAALFVIDSRHEKTAVAEAKKVGIPIVSVSGTDCDISKIDYPIVANDSSRASVAYFVRTLADAVAAGVSSRQAEATPHGDHDGAN